MSANLQDVILYFLFSENNNMDWKVLLTVFGLVLGDILGKDFKSSI